ncbi:MAG: cytochrome C [Lachnospiraceae bacterium]|nr:cytochrome C [Lachnospiraceae bacterium]
MPTITKKELEEYKKMCYDREHGRLLTIDGLRLICDRLNRDPEVIGKHFLETLARIQSADKR